MNRALSGELQRYKSIDRTAGIAVRNCNIYRDSYFVFTSGLLIKELTIFFEEWP